MGKPIKITEAHLLEATAEFEKMLRDLKLSNGKINFTKTFGGDDEKTAVYFTPEAWVKMVALINEFADEVAWHGIAKRSAEPEGYIISDILVYPQEVTGATVNTDQEKYQTWLMNHEDDVFNNIRMQGHSHVNMGCSPSSVDVTFYESLLEQLRPDAFYIFMIWNKKFENYTKVYDLQKNTLFDNKDVEIKMLGGGVGITEFLEDAKKMVAKKSYSYTGYSNIRNIGAYNPSDFVKDKKEKIKTKIGHGFSDDRHHQYDIHDSYHERWGV